MLDEVHDNTQILDPDDENCYKYGRIGVHNVVIACLPRGTYGIASAATVAKDMQRSFRRLQIRLMVGIAGGAPSQKHDIRLGDVVVGTPSHTGANPVVLYEFGKAIQDEKFRTTRELNAPPALLMSAVENLIASHKTRGNYINTHVTNMINNRHLKQPEQFARPSREEDRLYEPSYKHVEAGVDCVECCDTTAPSIKIRQEREKDADYAIFRDKVAEQYDILCFEMEAAGLANSFPCVVIRGICDYSDTHKNDRWQGYAATAAAAYAKELLNEIESRQFTEGLTARPKQQALNLGRNSSVPSLSVPAASAPLNSPIRAPSSPILSLRTNSSAPEMHSPLPRNIPTSPSIPDWSLSQEAAASPASFRSMQDYFPSPVSSQDSLTPTSSSSNPSRSMSTRDYSLSSSETLASRGEYALNVPPPVDTFVMRQDDMQAIKKWFQQETGGQPTILKMALSGVPACGKTQLAAKYCQDAADKKIYDYILWLNAISPSLLELDLKQIANQLQSFHHKKTPDLRDVSKCQGFLKNILQDHDKTWLMVFDNFDEPESFGNSLNKYIPNTGNGRVLVTSQRDDQALRSTCNDIRDVEHMQPSEAEQLLFRRGGSTSNEDGEFHHEDETEEAAWKELLKEMEYHALGVDIAASAILSAAFTATELLGLLVKGSAEPLGLRPNSEYKESPFTVAKLALSRIASVDSYKKEAYMRVLHMFVHIRGHSIEKEWFELSATEGYRKGELRPWMTFFLGSKGESLGSMEKFKFRFGEALQELTKRSIVKAVGGKQRSSRRRAFTMHHIMRRTIETDMTPEQYETSRLDAVSMVFLRWKQITGPWLGNIAKPGLGDTQVHEIQTLLITTCSEDKPRKKEDAYEFKYLDQIRPLTKQLEQVATEGGYPLLANEIWKGRKMWEFYQYPYLVGPKTFALHKGDQVLSWMLRRKTG
ncbi:MAG: hypothetical protein Q9165_008356 [Trypethelium subeluteriae]